MIRTWRSQLAPLSVSASAWRSIRAESVLACPKAALLEPIDSRCAFEFEHLSSEAGRSRVDRGLAPLDPVKTQETNCNILSLLTYRPGQREQQRNPTPPLTLLRP
jgi:hypothetical protein